MNRVELLDILVRKSNPDTKIVFVNISYEWYGVQDLEEDCFYSKGDVLYIQTLTIKDYDKEYLDKHYELYKEGEIELNEFPKNIMQV